MSIKLRELIRAVRACKTAQEERAVIAKECALIRTAFKDNALIVRHRNVAKLLFIHMLGYPSHFGQMECLKLIASPSFPEKRIGYLALMLLLDERTEVLTLVTNSLKNDLQHESQYVVGLALTSVGNLATADMARVLVADVACHLGSSNPYVRKKAALALIRILKRVPELSEDYVDGIIGLLKDRSHGVLIAAIQLIIDVLAVLPVVVERMCRVVPSLVKLLRNLLNLGYSPEHDVAGIADPFLQVKLLQLLALLGQKNHEASEVMNDVLAQVATNTETNRNAGNAILYECVKVVMAVESETGLKILAVNILGRFLVNRDNNIRYVALNSLSKVVNEDVSAVQRHRATILECLKDPDISIRQRALELTYQLVDANNITELVREMLNYLIVSAPEQRAALCSRVSVVVERFAPSPRWQVETLIAMLSIAGNHCDDSILCMTVDRVTKLTELHSFVVHKLFALLRDELPRAQIALVHLAVWCIGEYGDHLLMPCNADSGSDYTYDATSADDILGLLDAVLRSHLATELTKSYVLTALMKLSNYLNEGKAQSISLVNQFNSSLSLELHQRSCEYIFLLDSRWERVLPSTFARTPAAEQGTGTLGPDNKGNQEVIIADKQAISLKARAEPHEKTPTDLLGFDTILEGTAGAAGEEANIAENLKTGDIDLLCNIFPGARFGGPMAPVITAYQKSGLLITMHLVNDFTHSSVVNITCKFSNQTHQDLEKFIFQAAVPRYVTMEMKPASSSCVRANSLEAVTQEIKLNNTSPTKPLKMLIKIQYHVGGHLVVDQAQVAEFPPSA